MVNLYRIRVQKYIQKWGFSIFYFQQLNSIKNDILNKKRNRKRFSSKMFPTFARMQIFIKIAEIFKCNGVKSMTMDSIAAKLCISKKTLYTYADNKKDLVKKVLECYLVNEKIEIEKINTNTKNAIDTFLMIVKIIINQLHDVRKSTLLELEKYYPETFELLEIHRQEYVFELIFQNTALGVSQGWYRENLDIKAASYFYICLMKSLTDKAPDYIDFTPQQTLQHLIQYHLHAIASASGLEYIKEKINDTYYE